MVEQVIAVVGVKGGVGKSTVCAHLVGWAVRQGWSVGALDCDPQQAISRWLSGASLEVETITALTPGEVHQGIPELAGRYDLVLADGPAGEAEVTRALLLRASLAVLPCGPSFLDLRALRETAELVKSARTLPGRDGQIPDAVVCLNRQRPQELVSKDVIEAAPALGLRVAESIIRQRAAIADSGGQCAFCWDMGSRAQDAAVELMALCREVLGGE